MKIYFLPMLLSLFFLGACDKNDEIIPEDADENFITSVVMTVDGEIVHGRHYGQYSNNNRSLYGIAEQRRSGIQVHNFCNNHT